MHFADAVASVVVWCLASSAILRFADQELGAGKAGVQSLLLLPVLFGILLASPGRRLAVAAAAASGGSGPGTNGSFSVP